MVSLPSLYLFATTRALVAMVYDYRSAGSNPKYDFEKNYWIIWEFFPTGACLGYYLGHVSRHHLGRVWGISGGISGACLGQGINWGISSASSGNVWGMFGACLEHVWSMSGTCLGHRLGHRLGHVWGMSGACMGALSGASYAKCLGHYLGNVWGMSGTTSGAYCQKWTTMDNNPRCYMHL